MNLSDNAAARQILSTTEAIGVKLPRVVADAHARTTKLTEAAHSLPSGQQLAGAVADAIEADHDPTTDPAVLSAVVASQISGDGMARDISSIAFNRFREVCMQHADDIVNAWSKPFDEAAGGLRSAHGRLGDIDLDDSAAVLAKGGDAAEVWASARRDVRTIDTIVSGWTTLGGFIHAITVPLDRRHLAKRFADVDYRKHRDLETSLTPWTALTHGVELSLPTYTEYRHRIAAWAKDMSMPVLVVDKERSAIAGHEIRVPV